MRGFRSFSRPGGRGPQPLSDWSANHAGEAKGSAKARGALGYPAHATRLLPPRSRLHTRVGRGLAVIVCLACCGLAAGQASAAGPRRFLSGPRSAASTGTPQNQAPYQPGASPYATGMRQRPKYFVPPTNPRTPTWKMYGTPPGVVPGDWPGYAPLGFGGYRFPAVGSQAYR
jgi:hypothetical protein